MSPIFGLVHFNVLVWQEYSLWVLLRVIQTKEIHAMRLEWPSLTDLSQSSGLLQRNLQFRSLLRGVFVVVDGRRLAWVDYIYGCL